jgi:hypothetical protein
VAAPARRLQGLHALLLFTAHAGAKQKRCGQAVLVLTEAARAAGGASVPFSAPVERAGELVGWVSGDMAVFRS